MCLLNFLQPHRPSNRNRKFLTSNVFSQLMKSWGVRLCHERLDVDAVFVCPLWLSEHGAEDAALTDRFEQSLNCRAPDRIGDGVEIVQTTDLFFAVNGNYSVNV